jgi:cyclohexadieny/prephenate dehydrogenase
MEQTPLFGRVALIGMGLIGGSLALALRQHGLVGRLVGADHNPDHVTQALALGLVDEAGTDLGLAVRGCDLVVLATPVGTFAELAATIAPHIRSPAPNIPGRLPVLPHCSKAVGAS